MKFTHKASFDKVLRHVLAHAMNSALWPQKLAKVYADQRQRTATDQAALTLAVAELWDLARYAPDSVVRAYRTVPDPEIIAVAETMADQLSLGQLVWDAGGSDRELALSLGGQMRALDTELAGRPRFVATPTGVETFLCKPMGVYVVPRRDPKVTDRPPGPGNGFGRRSFPHHRVLPRRVGDYDVELIWRPLLSIGAITGTEQRFGAALMPGMRLARDPERNGWVAGSADCDDEAALLREQVEGSYFEGVMATVWPELSMPLERRGRLSAALFERSKLIGRGRGPALVAAGSWHEDGKAGVQNVMHILDKTGKPRLTYVKRWPFQRGQVAEPIAEGTTIPIVVNNDALITFAICLDFCERELEELPYHRLDVDLVLVASLGNETTMKGHEANAGDLSARLGGRTFVVQQNSMGPSPAGYVLPADAVTGSTAETRPWSSRILNFT